MAYEKKKRNKEDFVKVGVKIPLENLRINKPDGKSYGFKFGDKYEDPVLWVPKSQVTDWLIDEAKAMVFFAVPRWLFVENGMDQFHDEDYVDLEAL